MSRNGARGEPTEWGPAGAGACPVELAGGSCRAGDPALKVPPPPLPPAGGPAAEAGGGTCHLDPP